MSLSTDTESAVVDAFNESLQEAFKTMTGEQATCLGQSRFDRSTKPPRLDEGLTVIMGLSGELEGSVSMCLTREAALHWTRELIGHESSELDQTVIDGVGELANIVVGGCKRRLAGFDLKMGLPSVVRAGKRCLAFTTNTSSLQLEFEYAGSALTAVVALVER